MQQKYFYKYRTLNEFSQESLTKNLAYFASPADFNDPFDCKIGYEIPGTDEVFHKEIDSYLEMREPSMSAEEKEEIKKAVMKVGIHKNPTFRKQLAKDSIDKISEFVGIFCLSEKCDDILMWSHYSNGHQGYCLQFRADGVLRHAKPVRYQAEYPKIVYTGPDQTEWLETLMLTKSERWSYEKEWRLIHPGGPGIYQFPANELAGVILGSAILEDHLNKILAWLQKRNHPIEVYRASLKEKEFGVNINRFQSFK